MSTEEDINDYCTNIILSYKTISPFLRKKIIKRLVALCKKCEDENCADNTTCLVKKCYEVICG